MTRGNGANRLSVDGDQGKHDAGVLTSAIEAPATRRQIRSVDLFSGRRELLIEHGGELYSLRQTSKGKLILTK